MKYLKPLAIVCLFATFWSCSDDEDENGISSAIVGTWNYSEIDYNFTINGEDFVDFYVTSDLITEAEAEVLKASYEAALENSIDFSTDVDLTLTFEADGTFTAESEEESYSGTYSLENNLLTFDEGTADEWVAEVATLTNTELGFGFETTIVQDLNFDGTEDTYTSGYILRFTK